MSAPAPDGLMWDGKHLIEKGLATYHPWIREDGTIKGAVRVPYPPVVPELTLEEAGAQRVAKRIKRRRR